MTSRKKFTVRSIFSVIACLTLLTGSLTGCGKKENSELKSFQTELDEFTASVAELDTKINSINPTSDNAVNELLSYYDMLDIEFSELAEIPVPEEYSDVERLADSAGKYMSEAVSYYHVAFEGETLDSDIFNLASSYYEKAFTFVNYIGEVLMGADITFQSDLDNTEATE